MANFISTTTSNEPRLSDPDAASKVLDRYFWDRDVRAFILWDQALEEPHLILSGSDWPNAWIVPEGSDPADFAPDYDVDPTNGLEEFLKEIAPYLAEPLTIQAVGFEGCRYPLCACEWHIEPGGQEVEIHDFAHREITSCCA